MYVELDCPAKTHISRDVILPLTLLSNLVVTHLSLWVIVFVCNVYIYGVSTADNWYGEYS